MRASRSGDSRCTARACGLRASDLWLRERAHVSAVSRRSMIGLDDIRAAAERIRGAVVRTPCPHSQPLSALTGARIWCKFEHLQATGSFKERGARNRLAQLDDA